MLTYCEVTDYDCLDDVEDESGSDCVSVPSYALSVQTLHRKLRARETTGAETKKKTNGRARLSSVAHPLLPPAVSCRILPDLNMHPSRVISKEALLQC